MKNLRFYLFAAFAAFAVLSCQQEQRIEHDDPENEQEQNIDAPVVWTLDASFAPETEEPTVAPMSRTSLNGTKMVWSVGDKINVNGVESLALTASDIDDEDASVAHFQFSSVPEGNDLVCVYPASAYSQINDEPYVDFPADQSYDPSTQSVSPSACILVGSGTGNSCAFQHAAVYLEVTCDQPVKSIRLLPNAIQTASTGDWRAGMAISGARKIALDKNYLTEVALADIGSGMKAEFDDPGTSTVTFAVPPRNYSHGLNFLIVSTDGKYKIFRSDGLNFASKLGKIMEVSFSMTGAATYEGPGIYSVDDWCSFSNAFERTYVDANDIHAGSIADWTDTDGEVHVRRNFTVQGNLHRIGALISTVTYSDSETPFNVTLNGEGHTITQTASLVPLMLRIASTGVVKNLTLAGAQTKYSNNQMSNTAFCKFNEGTIENCVCDIDYTFSGATSSETPYYLASFCMDNLGTMTDCINTGTISVSKMVTGSTMMYKVASIAGLVKDNQGTMTRCYNEGTITATVGNQSLNFAGIAIYNSGTMTNCENRADVTIDYSPTGTQIFYGGGVAAAADDAYVFEGGSMAAAADLKATTSGSFYSCKNTGDITIHKTPNWSGNYLKGDAIGGVVGAINHGQFADTNNHNYTEISRCTNEGNIKVLSNTVAWSKSGGQVSTAVGGILGRATAWANNGYGALDVNNASSNPGNFFVIGLSTGEDTRWTNANTGSIEVTSTNNSVFSATISGARQVYVGGVVGYAHGGYKTNGTSYVYSLIRYASSEGTIKIGGNYNSISAGGIAGGCGNVKLIACKATTTFQRSQGESGLLTPTVTGIVGGAAGWVVKASQIQDCRISMNATDSPLFAGFMNLHDDIKVTRITANSSFTGTIGGNAVTVDDLNGTTNGTGSYDGDYSIIIQ